MQVMFACLADHAEVGQQGKLSIHSIFDKIRTKKLPTLHPRMFLVFRLMCEFEDNKKDHVLKVVLRDADHREVAKIEGAIQTPYVEPGAFITHNQLIELNGITFKAAGRYSFALKVNSDDESIVPFDVVQV